MSAKHTSKLQEFLVDSSFEADIYPNEPMSLHTTYRVGGPAKFFVRVETLKALTSLVDACHETETSLLVVGKGSNLLVSDEGFDGVVVCLGKDFHALKYYEDEHYFAVGAGAALASVVQEAFRRGVSGFEFAVGTPGTVGGALRMNAGSREEWIGSHVKSVSTYSHEKGLRKRLPSEITWNYRSASFDSDEIILEAEFFVEEADVSALREKMDAILAKRRTNQPMNAHSCGCFFKNPAGYSAGALIDQAGLKNYRIGGASVSDVHANFLVNDGTATARDVVSLMEMVQATVRTLSGVTLEPEVKFVGF